MLFLGLTYFKMSDTDMFRPPTVRSAGTALDRALFSKTVSIAAARVQDRKNISKNRGLLEKNRDLLRVERTSVVRDDPDPALAAKGGKCLLLKPEIKPDGSRRRHSHVNGKADSVQTQQHGVHCYSKQ